jgi:hypothetical protein
MRRRMIFGGPAVLAAIVLASMSAAGEPLTVTATPVPLLADDPAVTTVGKLIYRGGLVLEGDHSLFGGLSGLTTMANGRRLLAIGDRGYLFEMTPTFDRDGRLGGVESVDIEPLRGPDGAPLPGVKERSDAEAVVATGGDDFVVAFEHDHRLLAYRDNAEAPPRPVEPPAGMAKAPANAGVEALTILPDGRYLVLTEGLETGPDTVAGWIGGPGAWQALDYRRFDRFRPTGAVALSNGDVIVVERRFSLLEGQDTRIRRIAAADLAAGTTIEAELLAELRRPWLVDNFEGIAAVGGGPDGTRLFLVSDDNFNPLQRTLLVMFALPDER